MFKTQLYLPDRANVMLDKLAKQTGTSKSELVRQAVDEFLKKYDKSRIDSTFGMWADYEIDVRRLRNEQYGLQCISVITVAELYADVTGEKEQNMIEDLVGYFRVIAIDEQIAEVGGLFKNKYAKSHNVLLPDALIAATVTCQSLQLQTLNVKHYPMLDGLQPAYRKH